MFSLRRHYPYYLHLQTLLKTDLYSFSRTLTVPLQTQMQMQMHHGTQIPHSTHHRTRSTSSIWAVHPQQRCGSWQTPIPRTCVTNHSHTQSGEGHSKPVVKVTITSKITETLRTAPTIITTMGTANDILTSRAEQQLVMAMVETTTRMAIAVLHTPRSVQVQILQAPREWVHLPHLQEMIHLN